MVRVAFKTRCYTADRTTKLLHHITHEIVTHRVNVSLGVVVGEHQCCDHSCEVTSHARRTTVPSQPPPN